MSEAVAETVVESFTSRAVALAERLLTCGQVLSEALTAASPLPEVTLTLKVTLPCRPLESVTVNVRGTVAADEGAVQVVDRLEGWAKVPEGALQA